MNLTESIVEDASLAWFGELGNSCFGAEALTPALSLGERAYYGGVALVGWQRGALRQINPQIRGEAREEALRNVLRLDFPSRLSANAKQPRTLATLRDTLLPKLLEGEFKLGSEHENN